MDITLKQQADLMRRILTALGTDRGYDEGTGVAMTSTDQIEYHSTWCENPSWESSRTREFSVETTITVTTIKREVSRES